MKSIVLSVALCCAVPVMASPVLFSENFNGGASGWQLDGAKGEWTVQGGVNGSGALLISGADDGNGSGRWVSEPVEFSPGGVYGLRFKVRSEKASGGTVITGPDFCNVDIGVPGETWKECQYCFTVPDNVKGASLRFGHWNCKGDFFFDDIELFEVDPVYSRVGDVVLGEGESVNGRQYTFHADFNGRQRNHSRVLSSFTAGFNSQRWCPGAGSYVEYRHELPGRRFSSVSITVDCGYYQKGSARILASSGGGEWKSVGAIKATGTVSFSLPAEVLPAEALSVRIEGEKEGCNLQVYDYSVDATFDGEPLELNGYTRYLERVRVAEEYSVEIVAVDFQAESQKGEIEFRLKNRGTGSLRETFALRCVNEGRDARSDFEEKVRLAAEEVRSVRIPFELNATGGWRMELSGGGRYASRFELFVPAYFDCGYGEMLPSRSGALDLWQASSGWKIPRGRRLPVERGDELEVKLAANESEAVQLVLRPRRDVKNVLLTTTGFRDGRRTLPAGSVTVGKVGYVSVTRPTDKTGVVADWPDPILPQDKPCDLAAGLNQPYWIRVTLPKGVEPGEYEGHVIITADGIEEKIGMEIEVFDFELPDRMTCESAFGMNFGRLAQYHRVTSDEDRRTVLDKYLKCLSDNHISPYDPAPLDHWTEKFHGLPLWRGGRYVKGNAVKGDGSYMVEDKLEHGNVNARYAEDIKLTGKPLRVCFSHRSDKVQRTLFTLNQQRADGRWISGHNRDLWVDSSPEWKREEFVLKNFHREAASLRLSLWGAGYYEGQSSTGTTWFDDILITELEGGKVVFDDGDFESSVRTGELAVEFDWEAWDRQMERAFSEYHFNTFRCPVKGLGGGTFMGRSEPQLEGLREDQEAYSVLLEKYLQGIERHLQEKGWLEDAYVYWFDEPDPKDYEFVMNGFRKLKKYAPGLRRMLTEQVEPGLVGGPNLWCPLTPHLNVEGTEACREAGDEFWWYVCCGPKAPYATLFIDHPGVEMRLWLWQTWAERVTGILIWETVYWHSECAYPESLQNPYEDPMGWVNHVEKGERRPWGNGDGRFMYPPLSVYEREGPVTDGPNPTVRLEMLRDGLEDYEYFVILKKRLAEKGDGLSDRKRRKYEELLNVPQNVSKSLTDFNTDPAAIEEHREKLARAIEDLAN